MAPVGDFSGWDLDLFSSFPLWLTCVCLDRDRMSLSGGLNRIAEVQIVIVDYLCYDGCGCCTPRTVLEGLLRYSTLSPPYSYLQSYPPPRNMLLIPR